MVLDAETRELYIDEIMRRYPQLDRYLATVVVDGTASQIIDDMPVLEPKQSNAE